MAKAIIWWLSLLALSLLLFGCTAPEEVVDDGLGGEVENPVVNDAEAVDEGVAPVPEARPKVCDLLTVQDIASTCQNAQDPTLASKQYDDPFGFVDSCTFTINRINPAYGTETEDSKDVGSLNLYYAKVNERGEPNTKIDNVKFTRDGFEYKKDSEESEDSDSPFPKVYSEVIEVNGVGDYAYSHNSDNDRRTFWVAIGDHYRISLTIPINQMFGILGGGLADFSTICTYDEQKALAQLIVSRIR